MPTLTVMGSRSVSANRRLRSTRLGPNAVDDRLEVGDGGRRGDEQELVGAVAAHLDAGRDVLPERPCDREQRLVAGFVAMVVVEQPEVVDVDRARCRAA